tara:strand:+ start:2784 stop:4064 length:1281 start_codon:yes stop_codon:yes gene_type:complete
MKKESDQVIKKILILGNNDIQNDTRLLKNIYLLKNKFEIDVFGISSSKNMSKYKIYKFKNYFHWNNIREKFLLKKNIIQKIFFILLNMHIFIISISNKFFHFIDFIKLFKYSGFITKNSKYSSYDYLWLQDFEDVLLYFFLKKKFCNAKIIFDAHEIYDETLIRNKSILLRGLFKYLILCVFNKFSKNVDHFLSVSEEITLYYKNNFSFKENTTFNTVFNSFCYDFQLINSFKKKKHNHDFSLKKKLNIEQNKKIIIYLGVIHPWRGMDKIIDLALKLNKDFVCVFIGYGSHFNYYKSITSNYKNIFFLDKVPEYELKMWTKDAFLGLMLFEDIDLNHRLCLPNKLWQYASAEVPFVSYNQFKEIKKLNRIFNIGYLFDMDTKLDDLKREIENLPKEEYLIKAKNCKTFLDQTDYKIQINSFIKHL